MHPPTARLTHVLTVVNIGAGVCGIVIYGLVDLFAATGTR
jgi:hypothetical protein